MPVWMSTSAIKMIPWRFTDIPGFKNGGNFKFSSWDKFWNVNVTTVTIERRISFLVTE
jgi:hypothetical protein